MNVTLYENDIEVITLNKKIIILSNFELPSQTDYYANNTPDIYYKPKGIATQNKQVQCRYTYNFTDPISTTEYTDENGLIYGIKSHNRIGHHYIRLTASSDNLTEQTSIYHYRIIAPFVITQTEYDEYSNVEFKITFRENNLDFNNCITIINENGDTINYSTNIIYEYENANHVIVSVNQTNDNIGVNTMTVSVHGYTETQTFVFSERNLYELITTETQIGENVPIQIQCNDANINEITINGEGISVNSVTKNNDIFTFS